MEDDLAIPLILRLRANANALDRASDHSERALRNANTITQPRPAREEAARETFDEAIVVARVRQAQAQAAQAQAAQAQAAQAQAAQAHAAQAHAAQAHAAQAQAAQAQPAQAQAAQARPTQARPTQAQPARTQPGQPAQAQAQPAAFPTEPQTPDQRHRTMWASAMANVAGEYLAEMPNLPPAQRAEARLRANALSTTASNLLTGAPAQPEQPGNPKTPPKPPYRSGV
jgi:hypothetical protein